MRRLPRFLALTLLVLSAVGCRDKGEQDPAGSSPQQEHSADPTDAAAAEQASRANARQAPLQADELPTDPALYLEAVLAHGGPAQTELRAAAALVAASQADGSSASFGAAETALREALKAHPNDERTAVALGLLYSPGDSGRLGMGEPGPYAEQAAEALELALQINPANILAMERLAAVVQDANIERSVELREGIVELRPADLLARNRLAHLYVNQERLDLAERSAKETLAAAEESGSAIAQQEARFVLARVYMEHGEYVKSEQYWRSGAGGAASPHRACAYQGLGQLYRRLGQTETTPDSEGSHDLDARQAYLHALSSYDSEDLAAALHYIELAIAQDPLPAYKVLKGAFLLFDKRYDEAEQLFRTAGAAGGNDPGPDVGLGHLDIVGRQYSAARRRLEPALHYWLEHGTVGGQLTGYHLLVQELANLGMGWVCANQNRHDEAIDYFDRILSLQPEDLLALLGTGNSLIALGRLEEAESMFQRVLEQDSGNPYALAEMGTVRALRGDAAAAEADFQRALERGGEGYTCPYEGLGLLYLQQGRLEEARKNLQKAIEINPDIEYKKFNGLARIYLQEGRQEEARELLRRSIRNFPYDDEARRLLEEIEEHP